MPAHGFRGFFGFCKRDLFPQILRLWDQGIDVHIHGSLHRFNSWPVSLDLTLPCCRKRRPESLKDVLIFFQSWTSERSTELNSRSLVNRAQSKSRSVLSESLP